MNADQITALGMIGAWAESEEKFLLDKINAAHGGEITLTTVQAAALVEALNRVQDLLIATLNEAAA